MGSDSSESFLCSINPLIPFSQRVFLSLHLSLFGNRGFRFPFSSRAATATRASKLTWRELVGSVS
jgi:hypothetical protein